MRIVIPIIALLACVPTPADAATRNFGVSGFDRIRVDGPFKVRLATGVAPFAIASGSGPGLDAVDARRPGPHAGGAQRPLVVGRLSRRSQGPGRDQHRHPRARRLPGSMAPAASLSTRCEGLSFDLSVQGAGSASIGSAAVDQLKISISGIGSASRRRRSTQADRDRSRHFDARRIGACRQGRDHRRARHRRPSRQRHRHRQGRCIEARPYRSRPAGRHAR